MEYTYHYPSPLGGITLASDGAALTGLCFDGQKYFANTLSAEHTEQHLPVFDEADRWLEPSPHRLHDEESARLGHREDFLGLRNGKGEGLLAEDVLAGG